MEPLASSLIEEFDLVLALDHFARTIFGGRTSLTVGMTVAVLAVLSVNLIGGGLRDLLDPRFAKEV